MPKIHVRIAGETFTVTTHLSPDAIRAVVARAAASSKKPLRPVVVRNQLPDAT